MRIADAFTRLCTPLGAVLLVLAALGAPVRASAQETVLLEGEVPSDGDYFSLPFTVPVGTVEIEVRHDDLAEGNILDWGLLGPGDVFRGYGGGNSEPAIVNAAAASRSYLPGAITVGEWQVYVGKAKITELPARYRVEVVLRTEVTLAAQPERTPYVPVAALSDEARWYAGDFHVHSRESGDASPTLEEVADYAESIGLDFVMLSEHDTTSQLELYAAIQEAHPNLLFVPGIEVTTYLGHANAIGATEWVDHRVGYEGLTMDEVAAAVRAQGALFSINHPSLDIGDFCIGCDWMGDLPLEAIDAIEIQTGAWSVTGHLFHRANVTLWESMLAEGRHVVAVGGSDDHSAGTGTGGFDSPIGSPTTMVFATELSAAAIHEGVRLGRTVVKLEGPEDPMLELVVPDLEGTDEDTVVADSVVVTLRVTGGMGTSVRIVQSGVELAPAPVTSDPFEIEVEVTARNLVDFVRAEVVMGSTPRVLTNHFYLRAINPPEPLVDAGVASPDAGTSLEGGGGCTCVVAGSPSRSSGLAATCFALAVSLAFFRRARRRA